MEYIIDNEMVERLLQGYQSDGKLKYVKIDKVKIRNNITRCQNLVRDIFMFATSENSCKPFTVLAIQKDNKMYISHFDITHWNMQWDIEKYYIDNIVIYYHRFCNPVLQYHIWRSPETASKILKGNLMEGNPNDRYRTPHSVDQDKYCEPLHYIDGSMIKSKDTLIQFFSLSKDGTMDKTRVATYNELQKELEDDHNKVYCYCASLTDLRLTDWSRRIINRNDIGTKWIVSDYYRQYDYRDIGEQIEIEPDHIDIACVGCGSAGANIVEQVGRLNYFKDYLLVDFDTIEKKNLRNQPYNINDIGTSKVTALKSDLYYITGQYNIKAERKKYEEVFWTQYKSKYVISGFDTIVCRLGLLKKVMEGQIKTEYIIDARYDGLNASLFFIDTSDEQQMKYYYDLLVADGEEFEKNKELSSNEWTMEALKKYCTDKDIVYSKCAEFAQKLGIGDGSNTTCFCTGDANGHTLGCRTEACWNCLMKAVQNAKLPMPREYQESTCIAENIIHIYKLVSAWVVANIRSIESDDKKLFTHVEITTEPLPNAMILRK